MMVEYNGRKIVEKYENPIDNYIIALAEWLNVSVFHPLHFTPNMITSLSLLCGIYSAFTLYQGRHVIAAIMFLIAYVLDCADGNYARRYNMVTVFGDYYDHVSDVFKIVLIVLVILYKKDVSTRLKVWFLIIAAILFILSSAHLGCQERIYNPTSRDSLSHSKLLCVGLQPEKMIKITRHFGVGTFIVVMVGFILYLGYKQR